MLISAHSTRVSAGIGHTVLSPESVSGDQQEVSRPARRPGEVSRQSRRDISREEETAVRGLLIETLKIEVHG